MYQNHYNDLSNKQNKLTNPLTKSDVVNNLTTTTTNVPLSAAQGKVLNESMKSIGDVVQIGALTATSGTITLIQPLTNFREILFCVNITGVGVVASSQVAVNYFINYMNSTPSRHIVGTTLDKLYEADFYYASGKIAMLNGINISGVTIFGIK